MEAYIKLIMDELDLIKEELGKIEEAIPDKDMFLTAEEAKLIEESYMHEKEGKLISGKGLRNSFAFNN